MLHNLGDGRVKAFEICLGVSQKSNARRFIAGKGTQDFIIIGIVKDRSEHQQTVCKCIVLADVLGQRGVAMLQVVSKLGDLVDDRF